MENISYENTHKMDYVDSFSESQIETTNVADFDTGAPSSSDNGLEADTELTLNSKRTPKTRKKQKTGAPKHLWTNEEDDILEQAVKTLGEKSWSAIAARLPGRVGKQCRDRWRNHLCPEVKKGSWTKEEDRLLFEHQKILGNQWAEIAKNIPGRTDLSVKNRYYSYLRKVGRQKARREKEKEINMNMAQAQAQAPVDDDVTITTKQNVSSKLHSLRVDTSVLQTNANLSKNSIAANNSHMNENSRKRQRVENKENSPLSSKPTIRPIAAQTPMPKNNTFSAAGFPAVSPEQNTLSSRFRNDGRMSLGVLPRQLLDMTCKTNSTAKDETACVNASNLLNKPIKPLLNANGLDNESLLKALGMATSQNIQLMSSLWNFNTGSSIDLLSNNGLRDTTNLTERAYTGDINLGTTQNPELLSSILTSNTGPNSNLGSLSKSPVCLSKVSLDRAMLNLGGNFNDTGTLGSLAQFSSLTQKGYPLQKLRNLQTQGMPQTILELSNNIFPR